LPGVDGRSAWARRLRDLISLHLSDLGGADHASEAEKALLRRASVLIVELEHLEFRFAQKGTASAEDLDLYQRCAGNLRRLFEATGIRRRPRDVTPTLSEYLEAKDREAQDAELVAEAEGTT
jgi:hypothetical protein